MKCPQHHLAEEYVDQLLDEAQHEAYKAHLSQCTECREEVDALSAFLEACSSLSGLTAPAHCWEQIEAQLPSLPKEETSQRERPTFWEPLIGFFSSQGLAWGVCAVLLAVLMTQSVRQQIQTPATKQAPHTRKTLAARHRPAAKPAAKRRSLVGVLHELQRANQQYQQALKGLEQMALAKLKQRHPKHKHQMVRKTLKELDRAIAQCREVLRIQPNAVDTHNVLLAMYQKKVDLLLDIALGNI